MKFSEGKNRTQIPLFAESLDAAIDSNNEIRLIDLFVDGINLEAFGFEMAFIENGRPAYPPKDLLKLFIYGYLNRIRSSRQLEKECKRNIELMWLMKGLVPDHNTISNFRRDNPKAIRKVFHATVLSIMSEIGAQGFKKFESAKQFASWLRLAPNNKVSVGRILSSKIPKGSNRLKTSLRHAANVIGNLKNANLHHFFIRIAIRKGRTAAITETARKLAIIIWNMVVNRQEYTPISPTSF